jgi:integrase
MTELPQVLDTAVRRLDPVVGRARMRQLRWVAGEMAEADAHVPAEVRPGTAAAWFSAPFVPAYLALADEGRLRRRGGRGRPGNSASARVRRTCLHMLAGEHAAALPDLSTPRVDPPRERAPHAAVDAAVDRLVTRAAAPASSPGTVRAAALTALVADTGMRVGELACVRLADVDLDTPSVRWTPRPQASRSTTALPEQSTRLRGRTVAALRRWLEVRAELTVLTPRVTTLFVSVAGNHDGAGVRRPAGLPLRERGMQRAHDRAVALLNTDLVGAEGYPIPRVLGALRLADPDVVTGSAGGPRTGY